MYLPKLMLVALATFVPWLSQSQTLHFNRQGQLTEPPPSVLRLGKEVSVQIPFDTSEVATMWTSIQARFNYLNAVLNDQATTERIEIESELASLYCFFLQPPWDSKENACKAWINYVGGICADTLGIYKFVDKRKDQIKSLIAPGDCAGNRCQCQYAEEYVKRLIVARKRLANLRQKETLIKLLLCLSDNNESVFALDKSDKNSIKYLPEQSGIASALTGSLNTDLRPSLIAWGISFLLDKEAFTIERAKKGGYLFSKTVMLPSNSSHLRLTLNAKNLFNETIQQWHNKVVASFDRGYVEFLSRVVQAGRTAFNNDLRAYTRCEPVCSDAHKDSLQRLKDYLVRYDSVWCWANPIGRWLAQWLWYSGGDFKLNCFSFTQPSLLSKPKEDPDEPLLIAQLNETKQKITDLKKCLGCSIKSLDTLATLQREEAVIQRRLLAMARDKEHWNGIEKTYAALTTLVTPLHKLTLPLSARDNIRHVVYHNANQLFERFPETKIVLPEDRAAYIGFYNSKEADTTSAAIVLEEKLQPFNDTAKFTQELGRAAGELGQALTGLTPLAALASQFIKQISPASKAVTYDGAQESMGGGSDCARLRQEIEGRLWRYQLLEKLLADYAALPTPNVIPNANGPGLPQYYTFAVRGKQGEAPYTNSYTISYKSKLITTDRFSIGRSKLISVAAGLFYNTQPARQTTVDTAGGGLRITNSDTRAKLAIGLRVYPALAFDADGHLRPRYPLKRFSLFGGFEIIRPLNNLYVGIGYDLVPGLYLTAGVHIYRRNYYGIRNGQLTDSSSDYTTSGAYYGVALDPLVVTSLLKSFFQ